MTVERQQRQIVQQLDLFGTNRSRITRPGASGEDRIHTGAYEESQAASAKTEKRSLATNLMVWICDPANLNRAYKRVMANKGAPGVDGMTVQSLRGWLRIYKDDLIQSLQDGSYQPSPVRGVKIPKPGGGMRQLGIPTVIDRLVQQAILQVLDPILDPTFSDSSFGFRPGRNAHQALLKAREYVEEGRPVVVDCDLEKFFDRVNHDILMNRLSRHVGDKRLLRIIRRFLEAGILQGGVCVERQEGTPQGGPLSPLLANLLLDDLDKELEKRGHCFCRYADDSNIYVRTLRAGERVMDSITRFLEGTLKLRVNREKSAVAPVEKRKFLGYRLLSCGRLTIAPTSLKRAKDRVREITRRNRPIPLKDRIKALNTFLTGWVSYFRLSAWRSQLEALDGWIRRKLRCVKLKQCKCAKGIAEFLRRAGIVEKKCWLLAGSGKGWWRLSNTPQSNRAMSNQWFLNRGLVSLTARYARLHV